MPRQPPPPSAGPINIQPAVEARIMAVLEELSPAERRRREQPAELGQLLLACLADEAAAQYQRTQARGLVVHRTATHAMHYVPHAQVPKVLERNLALLPIADGHRLQATLEYLLLSYNPDAEAAIVAVDHGRLIPTIVTLAEHSVRMPPSPQPIPEALYAGVAPGLPRDVLSASAPQGDGARYWFFSATLGTLGRVAVRAEAGQTRVDAEFAEGDAAPGRNEQRVALFRQVTANLLRAFDDQRPAGGKPQH